MLRSPLGGAACTCDNPRCGCPCGVERIWLGCVKAPSSILPQVGCAPVQLTRQRFLGARATPCWRGVECGVARPMRVAVGRCCQTFGAVRSVFCGCCRASLWCNVFRSCVWRRHSKRDAATRWCALEFNCARAAGLSLAASKPARVVLLHVTFACRAAAAQHSPARTSRKSRHRVKDPVPAKFLPQHRAESRSDRSAPAAARSPSRAPPAAAQPDVH